MPRHGRTSQEPDLWNLLGFLSSIVGLVCFALSPSFNYIFGEWNLFTILLYITVSLFICGLVLFAKKIEVRNSSFLVKSHVGFLVLMLTSVYSFFYDKSVKGKPDALSIISYTAFAFASLCSSKKLKLGFEAGLFNFFLGFFTVQLMKINSILAVVAAVFCYSLMIFRCYSDSQQETEDADIEDPPAERIGSTNEKILPTLAQQYARWESTSRVNQLPSEDNNSLSCEEDRNLSSEDDSSLFSEYVMPVDSRHHKYAYRVAVNIGGHVFKGILYDKGVDNRVNGATSSSSMPDLSDVYAAASGGRFLDGDHEQDNVTSENNVAIVENGWKQAESDPQHPQLRRRKATKSQTEEYGSSSGSDEEKHGLLQESSISGVSFIPVIAPLLIAGLGGLMVYMVTDYACNVKGRNHVRLQELDEEHPESE